MTSKNFEKGGRNPPDAILYHTAKELLQFLNGCERLREAKQQILDRYNIETQAGHYCWPADVIKKAWRETTIMEEKHQEDWAFVITVQVIKSLICDECKQNSAQEELGVVKNYVRKYDLNQDLRNEKRRKEGAAGGDEQHSGGNPQTVWSQNADNNPHDSDRHDEPDGALIQTQNNNCREGETIYIRVPLSEIVPNVRVGPPVTNVRSEYKLIDGRPETDRDSVIRRRKSYVMSFNRQTGNADWVYEILNRSTTVNNHVEAVTFGNPYHRGHLAAAANHRWCREALNDTNMIDNIVPQHKTLNTGMWKRLENCCRTRATDQNINVHVYSGPLYKSVMDPPEIQGKRVPSHFFKVIIEQSEDGRVYQPRCYLFPNQDLSRRPGQENEDNVEQYRMTDNITGGNRDITIEDIQRDSGLTFIFTRQNAEAREITATLHGEHENAEQRTAEIRVIIMN